MSKPKPATSEIIAKAYQSFLDKKGVTARMGQKRMMNLCYGLVNSIKVDDSGNRTSAPAVCVIEAGTGTGKTLGYSIPLIPLAQAKEKTLILSTATVALQEQVVHKDLPDIRASAGLDFTFAMAKGRGRYFCKLRAAREAEKEMELFGFQDETIKILTDEFDDDLWNGDRDTYPVEITDKIWQKANAVAGQCPAHHCPHFKSCPFYKARDEMDSVDVIIANHDIVMADLSLGGGVVLPEPKNCIYVFDEGHHLTSKAISHFSSTCSLDAAIKWSDEIFDMVIPLVDSYDDNMERYATTLNSLASELKKELVLTKEFLLRNLPFKGEYHNRQTCIFPRGETPHEVIHYAKTVGKVLEELKNTNGKMTAIIEDKAKGPEGGEHKMIVGELDNKLSTLVTAWAQFVNVNKRDKQGIPFARWVDVNRDKKNEIVINSSPVHAGEMLKSIVWKDAHAAIITSATIRSLGKFDAYLDQAGLPADTPTLLAQSPFDYENNGVLFIPKMKFSPKDSAAHTTEVGSLLPTLVLRKRGCLVLFASKKQMTEVFEMMPDDIQDKILMQGSIPKSEIVSRHKLRIDRGDDSIIFGMSSFSEGVDLPGDYCNNVIIAKLPFMVPTDPVSLTLAEWMESVGRNTFEEISVPDACIKLIQSVGRLIRTEQDTGAVTILDNRLVTKRYGAGILDSLPPFKRVIRR
ncbi:ATP-dependent DNA helicase DinG [Klebsiella pneumoniae]|uniref:ATP-dependent DNA helicase DinG n=1 Tax=Klebsiella pneumoniae TaxID=573 RepID=UPI0018819D85|nr:ATP-dependent DNA helicase DinG [Klebsiella pneumoniae]MBE8852136.1 ATP-dependent DNA helicase DinG [Klebsiella pneumoniae]HAZ7869384.1 ATP-dependent DNA helicase DinG [Escherichia coli]HAZ7965782.1 ATP-dependent DNA helicase DinG [Escherichia coli]